MKRIRSHAVWCWFSVAVALGASAPALAVPSDPGSGTRAPLAFVAEFSGRVDVLRPSAKEADPVSLGLPLRRGDKIQIGAGGSATLLFNDGDVLELPERSALTIGARSASAPKKGGHEDVMAGVFKSVSQGVVGGTRETGLIALAPVRSGGSATLPLIVSPRQTEVLEDRPAFRWRRVPGASRYRVVMSGDDGELWNRETADSTLDYPADAAALARGMDYVWEVQALGDAGALRKEDSGFRVKSAAEAETVRKNLTVIEGAGREGRANDFLAGTFLAAQGLLHDASMRFASLCAAHPEEPAPHEALGRIYRAVGLNDEAAAELQKALALTRKP